MKRIKSSETNVQCCIDLRTPGDLLGFLKDYNKHSFTSVQHEVNMCIETARLLINFHNCSNRLKRELVVSWLHYRHDCIFKYAMMSVGLEYSGTDKSFRDMFLIDSNKTPDEIIITDKNEVLIIESTVVKDVMSGYMSKGSEEFNIQNKYAREEGMLTLMGHTVYYIPLIFDMSNPTTEPYLDGLKTINNVLDRGLSKVELTEIKHAFADVSNELYHIYSYIISTINIIEQPALQMDNTGYYNEALVDKDDDFFYQKLSFPSRVIEYLKEGFPKYKGDFSGGKAILIFDRVENNFKFERNTEGLNIREWRKLVGDSNWVALTGFIKTVRNDQIIGTRDITYEESSFVISKVDVNERVMNNYKRDENHFYQRPLYRRVVDDTDDKQKELVSIYADAEYEKRIVRCYESYVNRKIEDGVNGVVRNLNPKQFTSNVVNMTSIIEAINSYDQKNFVANSPSAIVVRYCKPSFMYPMVKNYTNDKCDLNYKNSDLMTAVSELGGNPYLKEILVAGCKSNFKMGRSDGPRDIIQGKRREEVCNLSRRISLMEKSVKKPDRQGNVEYQTLLRRRRELAKDLKSEKHNRVKLTSKSSKDNFNLEMKHYKQHERSITRGALDHFNDTCLDLFIQIKDSLLTSDSPMFETLDTFVSNDTRLFKGLKEQAMTSAFKYYDFFSHTKLYNMACFIENFCKSLAYYSQEADNREFCTIDNLGLKDVLLVVRGGKKIFRTKQSKFYRLVIPVDDWLRTTMGNNSSFVFFDYGGKLMMLTPWQQMHENLVNDGLSFAHKLTNFFVTTSMQLEKPIVDCMELLYLPILLSFHGRRQTEAFMHNMRYIIVAPLQEYNKVESMLPEFAGVNYDFIQTYLRMKISTGYISYCQKLIEEKVYTNFIGNGQTLDSADQMSFCIYTTYLMTKAPYNQRIEQAKNMKNILTIHSEWLDKVGKENNGFLNQHHKTNIELREDDDFEDYWQRLFEHDFTYDGKLCYNIGKFTASILKSRTTENEVKIKWETLMNRKYTDMATTKGLRGTTVEDRFGKKGYFIIYKELIKDQQYLDEVFKVMFELKDYKEQIKEIHKLNITFRDKMGVTTLEKIVAHAADKPQRGGGREVYVFDFPSKLYQMNIEGMWGFLCQIMPNEIISVPSNQRLQKIHSQVFEKGYRGRVITKYLTLDCRKWAPKSVINKFLAFLEGIKHILPKEFYELNVLFFNKKYDQAIILRKSVGDILINNPNLKILNDYLTLKGEYYEFIMPYSFIMGWFNYFSSLIHAGTQLYFQHILEQVNIYKEPLNSNTPRMLVKFSMVSHSDDSGGKIEMKMDELILNQEHGVKYSTILSNSTFDLYECTMHGANQLLSDKKCGMGENYFELLSILYIYKQLVSLTAKFLAGSIYKPTDKGPCYDMLASYSKVVEAVSYGASFEQAYIMMKFHSRTVWSMYHNERITSDDYMRPPQCMGMPDAHPLMVIVAGSSADSIRIKQLDEDRFNALLQFNYMGLESNSLKGGLPIPTCTPHIVLKFKELEPLMKKIEDAASEDKDLLWILTNSRSNNVGIDLYKFATLCKQPGFLGSLQDETTSRMISRAFYYRNSNSIKFFSQMMTPKSTLMMYRDLCTWADLTRFCTNSEIIYNVEKGYQNKKFFEVINAEAILFSQYTETLELSPHTYHNKITTKPTHITIKKFFNMLKPKATAEDLAIKLCCTQDKWVFITNLRNVLADEKNVRKHLAEKKVEFDDIRRVYELLHKYQTGNQADLRIYSRIDSDNRQIHTFGQLTNLLSTNSKNGVTYSGFVVRYNELLSRVPSRSHFVDTPEMVETFALLLFAINQLDEGLSNDMLIENLFVSSQPLILADAVLALEDYWKKQSTYYCMVEHLFDFALQRPINCQVYSFFSKTQMKKNGAWVGLGELCVRFLDVCFFLVVRGTRIVEIKSNHSPGVVLGYVTDYINSCLLMHNLEPLERNMNTVPPNSMSYYLGVDDDGVITVDLGKNLYKCTGDYRRTNTMVSETVGELETWLVVRRMKQFRLEKFSGDNLLYRKIDTVEPDALQMIDKIVSMVGVNEHNIARLGSDIKNAVTLMLSKNRKFTLEVDRKQVFENFESTEIYKKYFEYREMGLNLRDTDDALFPDDDGTMWDVFLKTNGCKQLESSDVLSMQLSAQGKVAKAAHRLLIDNYPLIYTSSQKTNLFEILNSLIETVATGKVTDSDVLKILQDNGLAPLLGSLVNDFLDKDETLFSSTSLIADNVNKFSFDTFVALNSAIIKTVTEMNLNLISKPLYFINMPYRDKQLLMYAISDFVNTIVESFEDMERTYQGAYFTTTMVFAGSLLDYILGDIDSTSMFEENCRSSRYLTRLPMNEKFSGEWKGLYNSLYILASFDYQNNEEEFGPITTLLDILPENKIRNLGNKKQYPPQVDLEKLLIESEEITDEVDYAAPYANDNFPAGKIFNKEFVEDAGDDLYDAAELHDYSDFDLVFDGPINVLTWTRAGKSRSSAPFNRLGSLTSHVILITTLINWELSNNLIVLQPNHLVFGKTTNHMEVYVLNTMRPVVKEWCDALTADRVDIEHPKFFNVAGELSDVDPLTLQRRMEEISEIKATGEASAELNRLESLLDEIYDPEKLLERANTLLEHMQGQLKVDVEAKMKILVTKLDKESEELLRSIEELRSSIDVNKPLQSTSKVQKSRLRVLSKRVTTRELNLESMIQNLTNARIKQMAAESVTDKMIDVVSRAKTQKDVELSLLNPYNSKYRGKQQYDIEPKIAAELSAIHPMLLNPHFFISPTKSRVLTTLLDTVRAMPHNTNKISLYDYLENIVRTAKEVEVNDWDPVWTTLSDSLILHLQTERVEPFKKRPSTNLQYILKPR